MKKLLSLLLPLALLLSLTACGEKSADEAARQTPPTLTVTSANALQPHPQKRSYDWTYTQGLQSMTVIACGAHPLDETSVTSRLCWKCLYSVGRLFLHRNARFWR